MIILAETIVDRKTGKTKSKKVVHQIDMSFDEYIDTYAKIEAKYLEKQLGTDLFVKCMDEISKEK